MGTLQGGFEYVVGAYSVTAVVLTGYAVSVFLRWRSERARARRDARRELEVS